MNSGIVGQRVCPRLAHFNERNFRDAAPAGANVERHNCLANFGLGGQTVDCVFFEIGKDLKTPTKTLAIGADSLAALNELFEVWTVVSAASGKDLHGINVVQQGQADVL